MTGTHAISTTSRRELSLSSPPPARQGAEGNSSHFDRNITCFLPGRAKDLSAPLYIHARNLKYSVHVCVFVHRRAKLWNRHTSSILVYGIHVFSIEQLLMLDLRTVNECYVPFPVANVKYTRNKAESGRVSSTKQKRLSPGNHVIITTSMHVNRMAWRLEGNIRICMGGQRAIARRSMERSFHPSDFFTWLHYSLSLQMKACKGPGVS